LICFSKSFQVAMVCPTFCYWKPKLPSKSIDKTDRSAFQYAIYL